MGTDDFLEKILESFDELEHINVSDIPNIDLYMDQVTTFMGKKLGKSARYPETDKIMTKTMINNYAKNDLLPAPVKKKYSREHIIVLIFIYYFKGILSINDIHTLMEPLTSSFFGKDDGFGMEEIYDEVFEMKPEQMKRLKEDVTEKYEQAMEAFGDAPEENRDFLKLFSFICSLSFDIYMKKMIVEKMIDDIGNENQKHSGKNNDKKDEKNGEEK